MKRTLLLICTLLCANVLFAQTEFIVGELLYQVTNQNEVKVKDCLPIATSIIIPTTVSNSGTTYTVTSIGQEAFRDCSSLTSITIPNSVTSIGTGVFIDCSSLISITIPNSVTSIGEEAFKNCSSLTSIDIPNNVTSIGSYTFRDCSSLTSIDIPNSVTSIGDYAFDWCTSLTSIDIPNSVTSIGYGAFRNCSSLTSISIPNGVTSIRYDAFSSCGSLTSIDIPNGVTSIEGDAFWNCDGLTSVTIPNSVNSIGDWAFGGCSNLITLNFNAINCNDFDYHTFSITPITTINLGDSVQRIPAYFAYNNNLLTSISIPNSVTSIGEGAFADCDSLDTVTCLATNPPTTTANSFSSIPSNKKLIVYCGLKNYYAIVWGSDFAYDNIYEIPFAIDVNVNNEVGGNVTIENNCSTATLTATANDCYQFVSWNDGNTDNPRIISFTSDTSLTAIFEDLNTELIVNICEGQVYTENGFNVSEAGVYTQNLTSVNGCDSIITLSLNVNPTFNTELSATICPGERFIGNGFNVPAGVYTQTLQTVNGCDSIFTLVVTTYPTFDTTITATINAGEMYSEFGFNESEAGTYVQNLQTVNGCDSTITLILDVNSSLMDVEDTELSFYPNPTDSKITFSSTIESIEVIDLTGRCVLTFSNAREINIESLPSGAYYLRLTNNDKAIMRKVIKK